MTLPLLLLLALNSLGLTAAQNIVSITVGELGSFFVPDSVNARVGDIVRFTFLKTTHGVVQSSFEKPCVPLQGGFDSGVVVNNGSTVSTWDLQITNSSAIWFFCPLTRPLFHCTTGMVGAINPDGESMVDQYKAAAKVYSGPPPTSVPTVLSGIGAVASAPPSTSTIAPADAGTSSVTPKTDTDNASTPTSTATSSPSSSNHTAAIVGGAVAGVVAVLATIIIIVILLRRRRPSQRPPEETVETHYFPSPTSPPPTGKSDRTFMTQQTPPPGAAFYQGRAEEGLPSVGYGYGRAPSSGHSSPPHNARALPGTMHVRNQSSQGDLAQSLGIRPIPSVERLHRHPYAHAGGGDGEVDGTSDADARSDNISALAKEVAAVLIREQNQTQQRQDGGGSGNRSRLGPDRDRDPPPDYKSRGHGS